MLFQQLASHRWDSAGVLDKIGRPQIGIANDLPAEHLSICSPPKRTGDTCSVPHWQAQMSGLSLPDSGHGTCMVSSRVLSCEDTLLLENVPLVNIV